MELNNRYLWIACTKDELELPVIVADTCSELAEKLDITYSSICNAIRRGGGSKEYKIRRVEVLASDL